MHPFHAYIHGMNFTPLFTAPLAVQLHVYTALAAIILGLVQFLQPKGTFSHKTMGWVWIVLLAIICLSAFGIRGSLFIGPVSVFHVVALYTLWSLFMGARAALKGDVPNHKSYMIWIFGLSLIVSALLAFAPGALLHDVVMGRRQG